MEKRTETSQFRLVEYSRNRNPTNDIIYLQTEYGELMVGKEQPYAGQGALLVSPITETDDEFVSPEDFVSYRHPYYERNTQVYKHWFIYFYLGDKDSEEIPEEISKYFQGIA